jgi:hypothetical protein
MNAYFHGTRLRQNLKFRSCYLPNLTRLYDRGQSTFMFWMYSKNEIVFWYTFYKRIITLKTLLLVQLNFLHFNYWKWIILSYFRLKPGDRSRSNSSRRTIFWEALLQLRRFNNRHRQDSTSSKDQLVWMTLTKFSSGPHGHIPNLGVRFQSENTRHAFQFIRARSWNFPVKGNLIYVIVKCKPMISAYPEYRTAAATCRT